MATNPTSTQNNPQESAAEPELDGVMPASQSESNETASTSDNSMEGASSQQDQHAEQADMPEETQASHTAEPETVQEPIQEPIDETPEGVVMPPAIPAAPEAPAAALPDKKSPKRKILLITSIVLVIVLNAGMAGASLYLRTKTPAATQKIAATSSSGAAQTQSGSASVSDTDKSSVLHYASSALHIEFDYPVSWRLSASASNNSIELSSEQFSFADTNGARKSGILHFLIHSKDSGDKFGYSSPDAAIVSNSKSLSYKNPTAVQRKVTNLTYILEDTYNNQGTNAADRVLVTGGMAYSKGQTLGDKDFLSTDPQIYAYIESCPEVSCKYLATAATTVDEWNSDENLMKIQDIIASIKVMQ